jgi:K+-sensing histidine kinase KdpD
MLLGTLGKARQRDGGAGLRIAGAVPDLTFNADSGLLQAALLNLLETATRFAGDGAEAALDAGIDNGRLSIVCQTEIAPAMAQKLGNLLRAFEEGRRIEGVRASDLISLEAAREVVHSHNGRLTIDNAAVRSITVVITLPMAPSDTG